MASTLPNLTWARTGINSTVSSTNIANIITAVNTCVTATNWVIHASAADYILFGPPAGSAIANMRILIAGDSSGPNAAQMDGNHTTAANVVYMGLAPESGKTSLTNVWNGASNPFDTDRWTGYTKVTGVVTTDPVDNIYAIYSDEIFCMNFYEASTDDMRGFIAGALIEPPDDIDGEGTPGRIYGYAASGTALHSNTFLTASGQFLGSETGQNTQARIFRPDSSTNLAFIDKVTMTTPASPRLKTVNDSTFFLPVIVYRQASPNNMYGAYRQIGAWQDASDGVIIQDSLSNDQGYVLGSQRTNSTDAIVFYNKS